VFYVFIRDMLASESVLRELYPGDTGFDSPNPANTYQLARQKLGTFSSLNLGIPYKWAQWMAGLHFVPVDAREQKVMILYTFLLGIKIVSKILAVIMFF
jgi:hypothetical protein